MAPDTAAADLQNSDGPQPTLPTEGERDLILGSVRQSVGLFIDDRFVIDHPTENGALAIHESRIKDGRLTPATKLDLPGDEHSISRSTGVLVDNGLGHRIVTAAHNLPTSLGALMRARFITGLHPIDGSFDGSQVFFPRGLRHFEESNDRDLLITTAESLRPSSVAAPAFPDALFDFHTSHPMEVFVVGYPEGRELSIFKGIVTSTIPAQASATQARGINIHAAGLLPGLSGAPVFTLRDGQPQLLAIVQGKGVRQKWFRRRLIEISNIDENDTNEVKRFMDTIVDALVTTEAIVEHNHQPAAISRMFTSVFEPSVVTYGFLENYDDNLLQQLLIRNFQDETASEVVELFSSETPVEEAGKFLAATLLRGIFSTNI